RPFTAGSSWAAGCARASGRWSSVSPASIPFPALATMRELLCESNIVDIEEAATGVDQCVTGILDSLHDPRMPVAESRVHLSRVEVEERLPGDVPYHRALTAFEHRTCKVRFVRARHEDVLFRSLKKIR